MKVRFHRDSIRLRLTPADVRQFRDAGALRETTGFAPGAELVCWLSSDATSAVSARLDGSTIEVSVPRPLVHAWARSDEVGIRATQEIAPGRSLVILIEKDFECAHQPDEVSPGETFFPHPANPAKTPC